MVLLDIQFNPTVADWSALLEATLAAEEAGYAAAWVYDHMAGRSLHGTTMLECCTTLGALAAATSRITLGTLVANVWNREPAVLAVAAASVVAISRRPFLFGLGAGASPDSPWAAEQHAVGIDVEPDLTRRHARVVHVLDLLERMWADDRDAELATFPLPRPRPTTLVGVNSVALARIAGERSGGVNVAWTHPRRDELLRAARDSVPADTPFLTTVWAHLADDLFDPASPARQRIEQLGIDRLVLVEPGAPDPRVVAARRADD